MSADTTGHRILTSRNRPNMAPHRGETTTLAGRICVAGLPRLRRAGDRPVAAGNQQHQPGPLPSSAFLPSSMLLAVASAEPVISAGNRAECSVPPSAAAERTSPQAARPSCRSAHAAAHHRSPTRSPAGGGRRPRETHLTVPHHVLASVQEPGGRPSKRITGANLTITGVSPR
jgi:hypothetical protein